MACGFDEIPNQALTLKNIPTSDANWNEISLFALSFDGYEFWRGAGDCGEFANQVLTNWKESEKLPESLSELRSCLFFEQRRYHHFGSSPENEDLEYIHALLTSIREKVGQGTQD